MRRSFSLALLMAVCCLILDQTSKFWARQNLSLGLTKILFPGFLKLTLTTNTGGAFSLWSGNNSFMSCFVLLFIIGILTWMYHRHKSFQSLKLLEILGSGFLLG